MSTNASRTADRVALLVSFALAASGIATMILARTDRGQAASLALLLVAGASLDGPGRWRRTSRHVLALAVIGLSIAAATLAGVVPLAVVMPVEAVFAAAIAVSRRERKPVDRDRTDAT